jgi:hypothetical protein
MPFGVIATMIMNAHRDRIVTKDHRPVAPDHCQPIPLAYAKAQVPTAFKIA